MRHPFNILAAALFILVAVNCRAQFDTNAVQSISNDGSFATNAITPLQIIVADTNILIAENFPTNAVNDGFAWDEGQLWTNFLGSATGLYTNASGYFLGFCSFGFPDNNFDPGWAIFTNLNDQSGSYLWVNDSANVDADYTAKSGIGAPGTIRFFTITNLPAFSGDEPESIAPGAIFSGTAAAISSGAAFSNSFFQSSRVLTIDPAVSDADAMFYVRRAYIYNAPMQIAIQNLVTDLKAAGVWTNLVAFYPLAGDGIQFSNLAINNFSLNLISTNYSIQWALGAFAFDTNGVSSADGNSAADTQFSPGSSPTNNWHLFLWTSGSTNGVALTSTNYLFGSVQGASYSGFQFSSSNYVHAALLDATNTSFLAAPYAGGGGFLIERTNATAMLLFSGTNATLVSTNVTSSSQPSVNYQMFNFADVLHASAYGNIRAASFGYGLTSIQASNYLNAVQRFENTLGRGTP